MRISKNTLHFTKFIGLLAVVVMIWLTSNRITDIPRFASGRPKTSGAFVNGKAEGTWIWWYENGKKMTEGNFVDGKRIGAWQTWYAEGSKKSESNYLYDKLNGTYTQWYKNGKVKQSGNYIQDKRDGVQQYYDTVGLLLEEKLFVNGMLVQKN
ncbi:MAG: toxin-antitoxin system YwqK family antitoxin [Bacteroidota bacterium]